VLLHNPPPQVGAPAERMHRQVVGPTHSPTGQLAAGQRRLGNDLAMPVLKRRCCIVLYTLCLDMQACSSVHTAAGPHLGFDVAYCIRLGCQVRLCLVEALIVRRQQRVQVPDAARSTAARQAADEFMKLPDSDALTQCAADSRGCRALPQAHTSGKRRRQTGRGKLLTSGL
jgi:hypothetical protein